MRLWAVLPELTLAVGCLLLVAAAGWVRGSWRVLPAGGAVLLLLAALIATLVLLDRTPVLAFEGTYRVDAQAQRFKLLILAGALITLGFTTPYFRARAPQAHAPPALLFATLGAMALASAVDVALMLLFLQLASMASYVLVALVRSDHHALEAAIKYFLFGAVALAVMGYGLSFIYGLTGSLDLHAIGAALIESDRAWILFALLCVLAGFGFKIAIVPFHFWAPDALGASAAPVAGFLSVVPKLGALAALARFVSEALPQGLAGWPQLLAVLALATMSYGNLAALRQRRLKRLLGYSTIAQAGYLLMAVAVLSRSELALPALGFYLAAYLLMNLGAFAVAGMLDGEGDDPLAWRSLAWRRPWLAAALAVSLLSLAGLPPLAGFVGKVLLLQAALDGGMPVLALIAALNMLLALGYYLPVIARMYFADTVPNGSVAVNDGSGDRKSAGAPAARIAGVPAVAALGICMGGSLLLGVLPDLWLSL